MDHPRFINSFPTLDAVNERDPRIENIFSLAHRAFLRRTELNAFNAPSAQPNAGAGAGTAVLPIIRNIARIIRRYKPYLANREIDRIQPEINQPPLLIMSMIHAGRDRPRRSCISISRRTSRSPAKKRQGNLITKYQTLQRARSLAKGGRCGGGAEGGGDF